MTTRTLPQNMPMLREVDYYSRKIVRSSTHRKIAQAQNWLWAKMVRFYGGCAYEGYGNFLQYNVGDPAMDMPSEPCPDGTTGCKMIASFICPPNWSGSPRLKIQGRSVLTPAGANLGSGHIVAGVFTMQGLYTGVHASADYSSSGNNDWSMTFAVPQDKTYQIKIWMAPINRADSGDGTAAGTKDEVLNISARYIVATSTDLGTGTTPATTWQSISHGYIGVAVNEPLSAALLRTIVRDTMHLYAYRAPEVCQSYLGITYNNTSTFTEIGRYKVYLPPSVTGIGGQLEVYCTTGGAGNEIRFLVDGTVKQTFTALAAGTTSLALTSITGLTADAEHTITIESKSTIAGADWGTVCWGVFVWENATTLTLPAGTTVPASFAPVDELNLEVDDPILEAVYDKIVKNNTWLAANRLRFLIGDWRHHTYKRIHADPADATVAPLEWDWTHGVTKLNPSHRPFHWKNITVYANADTDNEGSTTPNDRDGWAGWQFGYGLGAVTTLTAWPASQKYQRHGNRVCIVRTDDGGVSAISDVTNAMVRMYVRGRRLPPALLKPFDSGSDGPQIEGMFFENRGYFGQYLSGTLGMQWSVQGIGGKKDTEPGWYGPQQILMSNFGNAYIRGRLLGALSGPTNTKEGALFEMELQGALAVDAALTQNDLNALP